MLRPPHSTQEPPQIKAVESILDMDSDALANTKTIDEMLQALGSTSITIQASDKEQLKPKTEEKKPPPILTISESFTINAARVEEIKKKLPAFDVQKARLYEALPKLTPEFVTKKASEVNLDLSSSDTKKSKRISEEDKLIQTLASNNKKTIAEQKLITYRDFLTETNQLMNFNQTLDKIEDLNNQETIFSNHLNLLRPLSLQPQIANKEEGLKIEQKKFETLIISQSKELSPLSIFLQTSSSDTEQKKILDTLRDEPAESIFPIKESDPQLDSQSSGAPPLPPHVAKLAEIYSAERRGEKASWKMQAKSIKNNSEIEALQASKAVAIERHRRLEVEGSQIRQEILRLEKIKQQDLADSDSIPLDSPNLEEVIAREEELKRVLEEKKEQESRTRIEAWKIQQELQIQEALLRVRQGGEIPGLRPGQKPEIATTQIQLEVPMGSNPPPNSNLEIKKNILEEVSWDQQYLANLRGEETREISTLQKAAPDSLPFQGPYSPFPTFSGLQTLGAGPFALGAMQPQAPVQGNHPLAPAKTSPQNLQANANNDQVVVSPRNLPEGTSSIFMQVSKDANLEVNENDQNLGSSIVSDVDQLLENLSVAEAIPLSADQLLGGLFQVEFPELSEDLTKSNQIKKSENQITESSYTQPTFNLTSENNSLELADHQPQTPFPFAISSENLTHDPLFQGKLELSAQQSDVPPPPSRDEVNKNTPQTIPREQEEKKQFWQTFISTRLREKPSNSNQNSPRNNEYDSNQDQLDIRPQSSSTALESENSLALLTSRSTIPYSKEEDEIEIRKIGLYTILDTILKTNLEKQNTTEFDSHSIDEEEIDVTTAENNIEFVMTQIATLTLDLAASISKDENKQTVENLQSKPLDTQTTQNSSNEDPIIYSGIGIRIKLEKEENEECSLKITEVFENSDLKDEDVNKKITHIKCGDELKSISAIYEECEGHEEKFYTKIALIFRDEKQEKLTLKIDDEEKTVGKNIFIPEDKKGLNIYDNLEVTKIANKLREPRQNISQLTKNNSSEERRIA